MDLVMSMADVQPRTVTESMGHYGGTGWYLINEKTVGSEALRMLVQSYKPGGYTEGHPIHADREQAYYVISGTMTLNMNEEMLSVPAGSFVFIPRGVEHNHRNNGPDDLVFITISGFLHAGPTPPLPDRPKA